MSDELPTVHHSSFITPHSPQAPYNSLVPFLAVLVLAAQTASAQTASDTITVTATRTPTRLADTPSSVVVLGDTALKVTAAPTLDDALRQVAGFTLFRRAGSRVANPTAQGVSLRGVGASGASRAAVLDDGIPLNDPFGGWVFWGRVPRASVDRIEVLRGGASDLYGSAAMGGVVQFVRRLPQDEVVVETQGGSERTASSSLFASLRRDAWSASVAADLFTTAGYVLVDDAQRGAVDRNATSRHTALDLTVDRDFGYSRAFVRGSRYIESRNNGTPLQTNDTTIRQLSSGADVVAAGGLITIRAYGVDDDYAQTFSAIGADRATERLTVDQSVPSRAGGGSAQWEHPFGRQTILAGGELRQVSGSSDEQQFAFNGTTSFVSSGGRQRTGSLFAEDRFAITPSVSVTVGIRYDDWRNYDAHRNATALAGRSDEAWSPRLAALYRVNALLSITAAAYRAFRAPTLNELYRSFRVGNVLTNANESLGPERLQAFELGARSGPLRVNLFDMRTDDTIANVTLTTTPAIITRQRQNLGSSRSRGAEVEGEWTLRAWRLSAGWLYADSVVTTGSLNGKRLPQVPRNQLTAQSAYTSAAWQLGAQARWSGRQFDDDVNQLPLRSYFAADVFAARTIVTKLDATVSVENIFNRRVETSATPVITVGQPRAVLFGLRYGR